MPLCLIDFIAVYLNKLIDCISDINHNAGFGTAKFYMLLSIIAMREEKEILGYFSPF